ncbi:DUF4238 domain-containing protein [Pluralibacter gergoviae]|uniref:DUF4238 domain-containing protein n=1 Tax=Pluralibacter gergoviae TaxID=61647 RepID=UPI0009080A22|nr:DUF4238 domain-containing protein [Pluralibacter gergoviae]ELN2737180.1 DUF4238 domain-containing protein [Pluralibacter gergoviae]
MKSLQKKIKHHYVWAFYLKGWAYDEQNVWYITKKSNLRFDSVKGIARENDFYKVGDISLEDIELMKIWIKDCPPVLKKFHLEFINMAIRMQNKATVLSTVTSSSVKEALSNNMFEDYMSMLEGNTVDIIKELRLGSVACLSNKKTLWDFLLFLGYQFSRTKRMRDALLNSVKKGPGYENVKERWTKFYNKHWWFTSSVMAVNMSYSIVNYGVGDIKLLTNCTGEPFLTSDQPVINVNPDGMHGDCIDLYYPISDKRAILISKSGRIEINDCLRNLDEVDFFNKRIAYFAGDTLISNREDSIKKYKSFFNSRLFKCS